MRLSTSNLIELQPAGFGNAETVAEDQQNQTAVADLVTVILRCLDQPLDLPAGEVQSPVRETFP